MARPRAFDEKEVLVKVIDLFWEKGFEGTSIAELVDASGLSKASLYNCFGNKEALFAKAVEEYTSKGPFQTCRQESAIETLRAFYEILVSEAELPKNRRRGCFVFNSCLEFGNTSSQLAPVVIALGQRTESFFYDLIAEARNEGEVAPDIDIKKASQRAFATAFTIREMAKFKPEREFLSEIANATLVSLGVEGRVSPV